MYKKMKLSSEKGIGLIEIIAGFVIIFISLVGIYIGIVYAESRLQINYHERVAALVASGELDWQYAHFYSRKRLDYKYPMEVVIQENEEYDDLMGTVYMSAKQNSEYELGAELRYWDVEIVVVWEEPNIYTDEPEERTLTVKEQFYY